MNKELSVQFIFGLLGMKNMHYSISRRTVFMREVCGSYSFLVFIISLIITHHLLFSVISANGSAVIVLLMLITFPCWRHIWRLIMAEA